MGRSPLRVSQGILCMSGFLIVLMLVTSCSGLEDGSDISPEQIRLYASQTAAARGQQGTATFTPPAPSPTPTAASPTPTGAMVDSFAFVADASIPDGTQIPSGASFIKTWRIRNNGSSTWDSNYALVFVNGSAMGGSPSNPLGGVTIRPGEELEVSVSLVAPSIPGTFKGYWTLRNERSGKDFEQELYVQIETVRLSSNPNNFAGSICQAEWRADGNLLPCFGSAVDGKGYVAFTSAPRLETGAEDDEPTLMVGLPAQSGGTVVGRYPAMNVPPGSRLQGIYGCTYEMPSCNVSLLITYRINNGSELIMGEWQETYNDDFTRIDVDLDAAGLANQSVQFIFTFRANTASEQNQIFLLSPRIQSP